MRVFSFKSYFPSVCSCKPSIIENTPCSVEFENGQHVSPSPAAVSNVLEEELPGGKNDESIEVVKDGNCAEKVEQTEVVKEGNCAEKVEQTEVVKEGNCAEKVEQTEVVKDENDGERVEQTEAVKDENDVEKIEQTEAVKDGDDVEKIVVPLKSILKRPSECEGVMGKGGVKWMDRVGKELVETREFECCESGYPNEYDSGPCLCVIQ